MENSERQESLHFQKPLQYSDKKKCVGLLRPWRDEKHVSTSKAVFTNMSVYLSVHTL